MNIEQLDKGRELIVEISVLENEVKQWGFSEKFGEDSVYTINGKNNKQCVSLKYVDFNIVKTLTLSTLQKKLTELQKQFDEL